MNRKNQLWITAAVGAACAGVYLSSRRRYLDLKSKVVVITGGSRGLGLVMARKVGAAGAKVVICSRNPKQLLRAKDELESKGVPTLKYECDITDANAVDAMIRSIEIEWGSIDVLINNAGVIQMGPVDSQTPEDYEMAMRTHFWGPLNVITAVIPGMRNRRSGRIVNICSVGGKVSVPHLIPYCASKFALVGLSEGLGAELEKDGITVTTVCPGLMRTGSNRNALFKGRHREEYAWFSIADSIPSFSMNAERAANRILVAMARGDRFVVLGVPARVAVLFHDLFPNWAIWGNAMVNRLLPAYGGIGRKIARGAESHSEMSPSWVTALTEQAAVENNELD